MPFLSCHGSKSNLLIKLFRLCCTIENEICSPFAEFLSNHIGSLAIFSLCLRGGVVIKIPHNHNIEFGFSSNLKEDLRVRAMSVVQSTSGGSYGIVHFRVFRIRSFLFKSNRIISVRICARRARGGGRRRHEAAAAEATAATKAPATPASLAVVAAAAPATASERPPPRRPPPPRPPPPKFKPRYFCTGWILEKLEGASSHTKK